MKSYQKYILGILLGGFSTYVIHVDPEDRLAILFIVLIVALIIFDLILKRKQK